MAYSIFYVYCVRKPSSKSKDIKCTEPLEIAVAVFMLRPPHEALSFSTDRSSWAAHGTWCHHEMMAMLAGRAAIARVSRARAARECLSQRERLARGPRLAWASHVCRQTKWNRHAHWLGLLQQLDTHMLHIHMRTASGHTCCTLLDSVPEPIDRRSPTHNAHNNAHNIWTHTHTSAQCTQQLDTHTHTAHAHAHNKWAHMLHAFGFCT